MYYPQSGVADETVHAARNDLYTFCLEQVQQQQQQQQQPQNTTGAANNDTVVYVVDQTQAMLQCMASKLQDAVGARSFSRSVLLVYAATLVFFMQAGFAMVCAGAVRKKNVQNTMLKNLLDACGAAVAFFTVGYAFAFGGSDPTSANKTFVGTTNFFLMNVDDLAFWLFEYAFSAASATIVAGALAERCQMVAYLCYSVMLTGWVYPIIAHAVWSPNGFLSAYNIEPLWGVGMVDFAGCGVVHVTGGITALIATIILGPRRGRFHDETGRRLNVPREFPGHSMALQMLGTFILWFGWYGFNAGSALLSKSSAVADVASLAAVNTTLAGGTAGLVALFLNLIVLERVTGEPFFDVKYAMNGSLCGLVSITAGCGIVEPWAAVVTGAIAGCLYLVGSRGLVRLRIDDAVDAIPVHFLNGMWGLLSVGLFASPRRLWDAYENNAHPGLFYTWGAGYSDARLLGTNLIGLLFIVTWVSAFMFPFFIWLDWRGWFRSDPLEEIVGLDTSYHGGLFLMNGEDEVHPEYISAYKQKREGLRQRKPSNMMTTTASHDGSSLNAEHGNNSRSSAARRMMQQQHQHRVAGSRNGTHSDEEDGGPNDQDSNDDESDYEDENDYDHEQGSMSEHTPPEGMVRI